MNRKRFLAVALIFLILSACSGRLPKAKTAGHVIDHYFHKYGREFKTSDFGKGKVEKVDVFEMEELHKNLAAVTAEVKFSDGPSYMVRCVLEKKSFGWRFVSWERL